MAYNHYKINGVYVEPQSCTRGGLVDTYVLFTDLSESLVHNAYIPVQWFHDF